MSTNFDKWTITQILPADNYIVHVHSHTHIVQIELACWALVKEGRKTFVTGMVTNGGTNLIFCESLPGFMGYMRLYDGSENYKESIDLLREAKNGHV